MSDVQNNKSNEWNLFPLSGLVDCLDGQRRPVKKEDRENIVGKYPYYGASGIIDFVNDYIFDGDYILLGEDGENVISRNLPLAFKICGKNWVNNHAHVLKPKANFDIDYLVYILENHDYKDIVSGSAQPKINQKNLMKLEFLVPKFNQQKRIAQILTTCDTVIEQTQATIEKYKAIKQGMLHDLFTRGLDANGQLRPTPQQAPERYKNSELGLIPKEWEVKRLEELTTKIGDGIHTTPNYVESSDYHFINGNNLSNGFITISGKTNCVSTEEYEKHKIQLNDKTLLMSINGTIGNLAYYRHEKVILGKSAAYICCNDIINEDYLFYLLSTKKMMKYFEDELTGSTIKNLSLASIRKSPILYPKIEEQIKLVNALSNFDTKLQSEEALLSKYQSIKKGLMKDLLSGERPLTPPDKISG